MTTHSRIERDSMGEVRVPEGAFYGPQTQRAVENFPISGMRFQRSFIGALGLIKASAAKVNGDLGELPPRVAAAVEAAANQVMEGAYDSQFVVDIFQTGSGTSTNMNANEVIGKLAGAYPKRRGESRAVEQRRDSVGHSHRRRSERRSSGQAVARKDSDPQIWTP